MADRVITTRRAILRAIPATALTLAAPAALAAPQPALAQGPAPSPLLGLIETHRAALVAYDAAGDARDAACARVDHVLEQVPLFTSKRDGTVHYAWTAEQIDLYALQRFPTWRELVTGEDMEAERTALAGRLKADLAAIRAENIRREAAENLPALNAARDAAMRNEIAARLALLACRPRDDAEAKLKATYCAGSEPFRDNWLLDDPDEMRALLALLAQPEGTA